MATFKNKEVTFTLHLNQGEDRGGNLVFNEIKKSSKYSDLIAQALNTIPEGGWKDVKESIERYELIKKFEKCNGSLKLEKAEAETVKEICGIGKFPWAAKLSDSFIEFGKYIDGLPEEK